MNPTKLIREHRGLAAAALAVAVVAVLYFTGAIPHLPNAEKLIENVAQALGPWTYVLVGLMAFLETGAFVGLIAPGETTVIVGGVIAGQGEIELIPLIGLVWVCAVLGDTTSFFIGRRLGRGFILRHGPRFKITEERLNQVEVYFERHGGKTILIGRFVGLIRALAPFVVGSSGFPYRRFLPFSVIGCGLWGTLYCVLGYIFYRSFDKVAGYAGKATLGFAIVVFVVAGMVLAYRRWGRQLMDRAGPRLRFLGRRLTPGGLGLEFTTTLAVSGVGLYVFTLYAVLISGGRTFTPADRRLLALGGDLRTEWLTSVLKVVTDLGALPIVIALSLPVLVVLANKRHFAELASLAVGVALLFVAVNLAKAGIDRPRPSGGLTTTEGSSFPSGHAAYSTIWIAVAVVVARALPGFASRAALVGVGVAIAAVVGLSRIYLRAHYWSDVVGGWGLGAGILGLCAAVALVVNHIRNNAQREPTA